MSPARLSVEDMTESELSFEGLWPAQPNKKQKMQPNDENLDMYDDIASLWETKWKSACKRRQAPFQDASYLDFAPLFASLIQRGITTTRSPLFTQALVTAATTLADEATITAQSNPALASQQLLNACALLRVARYPPSSKSPSEQCTLKQDALILQKAYHARAARLWDTDSPLDEVLIPHVHGATEESLVGGRMMARRAQIPALVRVPLETLLMGQACPAAVIVSSDRMGCTETCERVLSRGWAAVVVDGPGRGECPVSEGEAEEGLWKSVLSWMAAMGFYDMENVVVIGEGGAALRVAGTVGERLRGVVAYLDREESVDEEKEESVAMFEQQPRCPSLIVNESTSYAKSNGLWTPVKDEEETSYDSHSDLYAFGTEHSACIGQLHTMGRAQVYAWVGDLMIGRSGGYFWTVIPAPEKMAGAVMRGRFERELTPPSPEESVETRSTITTVVVI
ncbi:hypothetical protein N0V93_009067 [Gnomoniopsis smithogilvyi]|uniref:Uncharacterized protein n=1 Tax=Gnomoniopsis smithogilvyi TaxID=1191159 RepID=A0A9W9CTF5_9PEZI|nr:hypothetical protein N0V93_009067 [Gnomoniopsis smithogilvyi]